MMMSVASASRLAQLEGIHELEPDNFSLNMEACTLRKLT